MVDFLIVSTRLSERRNPKQTIIEVYPRFVVKPTSDLMIRGGDFYAVWLDETKSWSTNEHDAIQLIDRELDIYYREHKEELEKKADVVKVLHMWDAQTGMIDRWHKFCQKQLRDGYHMLDEELIFANSNARKEDYSSKKLPYSLEKGDCPAYEKLISTLYSPEERHKIEWAIGSILTGDSKSLQKFMVLYGSAGTGKSTIMNIIQQLFEGYYCVFDAKALGSSNSAFALEYFKDGPLVAIQHDGDLSRIEDNTRLNSLVSHELMTVNEKHKSLYSNRFKCFLFLGTNKPVKITDAKSGLIRRLIDVSPTGDKLKPKEYKDTVGRIKFELGAIAYHCREVYLADPGKYDDYIPISMLGATNDFYNFVFDAYFKFKEADGCTMKQGWEMYKTYCEEAKVAYPMSQRAFKEELKNYFDDFKERFTLADGTRVRNYYSGFKHEKFEDSPEETANGSEPETKTWLYFKGQPSIFDNDYRECPAQYANDNGTPRYKWSRVTSKLKDLDTSKLHYVKVPIEHIVIDFDIKDESGEKSIDKNVEAASKWPETYAELSQSGNAIHLHYIYTGDPTELSRLYDDDIEVKVYSGDSSLRRKLTKNNGHSIATLSSGLPKKEKKKMIDKNYVETEKSLRRKIIKNLNKEYHPNTKPSMDFIFKILEDAYDSGIQYDVSDMHGALMTFAMGSTHQKEACLKLLAKMKLKSKEESSPVPFAVDNRPLCFYDVEVFPNLFLVNWKYEGDGQKVVRMINPSPIDIEYLMEKKLVGFNCRRYDNHILYARMMGYTNEQLYKLSQRIISGDRNAFFREAYNVSYTDVYDFSATKQSLKKFEIELGIHHKELGLPWDQPVDEKLWTKVAEYCDNDVIATEATFNALKADFEARQTLAKIAGGMVNDNTNTLTTKLIFGNNKHPQDEAIYTDLSEMFPGYDSGFVLNKDGILCRDHPATYMGEEPGEGGYVYAEPGVHRNVALLDIASMHPHSLIALKLFGERYTKKFEDLVKARLAVKHRDREALKTIFGGAFAEFADAPDEELNNLANALKIAINSVYGLTSANFDNPFKDPRNVDNIVAKRGALFMINLKHEVQNRGFTVAHIKTDSIKIPDATPEIIEFVNEYGKKYGYTFEHEATYDRMCLVNDAVYIAKYADADKCEQQYGYIPDKNRKKAGKWDATGKQFQVPYIFKTLFSKEPIKFSDLCETRAATSSLYLDFNEDLGDTKTLEKELAKLKKEFDKTKSVNDTVGEDLSNDLRSLLDDDNPFKDEKYQKKVFEETSEKLKDLEGSIDELKREIAKHHNYTFVGKVGSFCPVVPGVGGGLLMREQKGKYNYAAGCSGYRWLEAETVKNNHLEDKIDRSYFRKLVDDAVAQISKYEPFDEFIA